VGRERLPARHTESGCPRFRSGGRVEHGGELTFETETGKGTTFLIRLPIEGKARKPAAIAA